MNNPQFQSGDGCKDAWYFQRFAHSADEEIRHKDHERTGLKNVAFLGLVLLVDPLVQPLWGWSLLCSFLPPVVCHCLRQLKTTGGYS
jgi:hypothetical protein